MKTPLHCVLAGYLFLTACTAGRPLEYSGVLVDELITPSYDISIYLEGGFDSNVLNFVVQNRNTNRTKVLKGQKITSAGSEGDPAWDGVIGYRFQDGADIFFITEGGQLTIKRNKNTVLRERGEWQEAAAAIDGTGGFIQ